MNDELIQKASAWFTDMGWKPFPFQKQCWDEYLAGKSGLINAPTGFGKTYALIIPILLEGLMTEPNEPGVKAIWVAPIRALTKEIKMSCQTAISGLGLSWTVDIRSGDTSTQKRKHQIEAPPDVLITTPESVHVLLASRNYHRLFKNLRAVVVDEWHELMGSKRGVQVELGLSRLKGLNPSLKVWGVSATIENVDQAIEVLLGAHAYDSVLVRSNQKKVIAVETVLPDEIEKYPWAGHLGIRLLEKVLPIIHKSRTSIIFTNTRSQCEIWYQRILDADPSLAGAIAMHHGSINREIRDWVEDALHNERLKAVVSTSSLDLGVDFRPVETIIQVGSPKGVSRFIQRAGRSGHQPNAVSKIYFVPTHALEMVEGAALRSAISLGNQEPRIPHIRSFDVLIQYLMTLAVSGGFHAPTIYDEIKKSHCYASLTAEEWAWCLDFLVNGGSSLGAYDQYQKVVYSEGLYRVANTRIARMHRMSIGTIVSDVSLRVAFLNGKGLGTIEESFVASLKEGDVFWFAGQAVEFIRLKDMTVQVKPSRSKKARVPAWGGGRMSLSSMLSFAIRQKLFNYAEGIIDEMEMEVLGPLLELQREQSILPREDEFLIEYIVTDNGYHLLAYPFEGRFVHEGMAALLAKRISNAYSITFSIAMNDYGFELLSDKAIDLEIIHQSLFSTDNLLLDIQNSMNSVEMARRKFRDIAKISGLIFQGYPGKQKKERHLQSSSSLLFDVFQAYEPNNLLYQQTYEEVLTFQLEESRLRKALERIQNQKLRISVPKRFSPFSFPIVVDRLSRERLSSESLEDRVKKLIEQQTN